jgi:hypothetical protein
VLPDVDFAAAAARAGFFAATFAFRDFVAISVLPPRMRPERLN